MPSVAAYIGTSGVSILIEKSGDIKFLKIPFAYTKSAFSNVSSQSQFYRSLIENVLKKNDLTLGECEVYVSGLFSSPEFLFKPDLSTDVVRIISDIDSYTPIFCTQSSILTKSVFSSYCPYPRDFQDEDPFLENISIFPQIISEDNSVQAGLDEKLCSKMPVNIDMVDSGSIIFTGDRFAQNTVDENLDYVLILSLIKSSGIYDLFVDRNNHVVLNGLYNNKFNVISLVDSIGTLVSTRGPLECLLNTGVGTEQFFEVEKNSIFIMPIKDSGEAKLSLKSTDLGSKSIDIKGGSVGLIFDTRDQKTSIYEDIKLLNSLCTNLDRIISR